MSEAPMDSVAPQAPAAAPAPAQSSEQSHRAAENALQERVSAKIDRAIKGQRAPDGKFAKVSESPTEGRGGVVGDIAQPEADAVEVDPKAVKAKGAEPKVDPKFKELETKFSGLEKEHGALKARDAEWTDVAEKMLARFESQKSYIAQLEKELQARGAEIDPRDKELARYREMERAQKLAADRGQWEQQQAAESQRAEQEQAQMAALTNLTKQELSKAPELLAPENVQHLRKAVDLILKGVDPTEVIPLVRAGIQAQARPAPRTLAGRGSGSLGPKLTDPRDIADKWKQRIQA